MSENQLSTPPTPKNALASLASRLNVNPEKMEAVLKATVFKACKNDEQFAALVIVANEYGLNPLTKEIYAFPGKGGEIVPIVPIDGWLRIINSHPQMDGMRDKWADDGSWCEVTIFRKDRSHPTIHREHLEEVKRATEPWKQHPRRMLKWKTIIQTGRVAFGFGGIHDEDEGRDAAMRDVTPERKSLAVRETQLEPGGKKEAPTTPPPANPEKKEPEGRQVKERHFRDGVLKDISAGETASGKTCWIVFIDVGQKTAELRTFSSTLAERLGGRIGDTIRVTFTQGARGHFELEDFSEVEANTEGSLV